VKTVSDAFLISVVLRRKYRFTYGLKLDKMFYIKTAYFQTKKGEENENR